MYSQLIFEMLDWLYIVQNNQFTNVTFDRIRMTVTVNEDFQQLRLGTVRLAVNNGRYRKVGAISRLRVRPGDTIKARVPLRKFREQRAFRTIRLRMTVPRRLSGRSMTLGVFGGLSLANETNPFDGKSSTTSCAACDASRATTTSSCASSARRQCRTQRAEEGGAVAGQRRVRPALRARQCQVTTDRGERTHDDLPTNGF